MLYLKHNVWCAITRFMMYNAWCIMGDEEYMMDQSSCIRQDDVFMPDDLWYNMHNVGSMICYASYMRHAWCVMHEATCMMRDAWCGMHDVWCKEQRKPNNSAKFLSMERKPKSILQNLASVWPKLNPNHKIQFQPNYSAESLF